MKSQIYTTKVNKLAGTSYGEVYAKAKFVYKKISLKTKRRPYIRAPFFKKEKVFLDLFWVHLMDKNWQDRLRRLKFYACALDLIQNSHCKPTTKDNLNNCGEILHRFSGVTKDGKIFYVQIKENKKDGEKKFMSVFP